MHAGSSKSETTLDTQHSRFCPGGRDVSARRRAVEELDQVCRLAAFRQQLEEGFERTVGLVTADGDRFHYRFKRE